MTTDGDKLKSRLQLPGRRILHCIIPLLCSQGQVPTGWLLFPLAQNLRTDFAICFYPLYLTNDNYFIVRSFIDIIYLFTTISITFIKDHPVKSIILLSLTVLKSIYLTLFLFLLSFLLYKMPFMSHPIQHISFLLFSSVLLMELSS